MRILHIVPTYIPAYRYGGPIKSVHGLCQALAKKGHEVHVFTTNADGDKDSDVPLEKAVDIDGVKVWYFPSGLLRRLYWSPRMKKALQREVRTFDVLHLHSIFLWPTLAAARSARKAGTPYIISPRGMLVAELIRRKSRWLKTAWITFFEKKTIEHAAAVHVTSEVEEEEARHFKIRFPETFIIPNGIDNELLGDQGTSLSPLVQKLLLKGRYILFLGRINWKKGLDRLIPALAFIPGINLVIAGNDEEGYREELEGLATANRVSERIIYAGPVYGKDKASLLKNAAVFILPSYSENFGNAALEAMAVGCPVVVTPEVGLSETVRKTGSGKVVQGDAKILGTSIKNLLSNPELMRQMGEKGQEVVRERFTWNAVACQMEDTYRDILKTTENNE